MCIVFPINWVNSFWFLFNLGLNYDLDMFLANLPVPSLSEIMFYTYVIIESHKSRSCFLKITTNNCCFQWKLQELEPQTDPVTPSYEYWVSLLNPRHSACFQ